MKPRIFVSTVTTEFKTARTKIEHVLEFLGYEVVQQDIFGTEGGDLRQMLREKIDACDALIQLAGDAYGAEPPTTDPDYGRVSYTQFEFLYARLQGKKPTSSSPVPPARRTDPPTGSISPGKQTTLTPPPTRRSFAISSPPTVPASAPRATSGTPPPMTPPSRIPSLSSATTLSNSARNSKAGRKASPKARPAPRGTSSSSPPLSSCSAPAATSPGNPPAPSSRNSPSPSPSTNPASASTAEEARALYKQSHDVLAAIAAAGKHVSPQDREVLEWLKQKLGLE